MDKLSEPNPKKLEGRSSLAPFSGSNRTPARRTHCEPAFGGRLTQFRVRRSISSCPHSTEKANNQKDSPQRVDLTGGNSFGKFFGLYLNQENEIRNLMKYSRLET
jgi:hypothetical protein